MISLHANDPITIPPISILRADSLTLAERRAKLLMAQNMYRTLVAHIWGPENTLLVTPWEYEHYSMYELQTAWLAIAYWRGQVTEAERSSSNTIPFMCARQPADMEEAA